MTTIAKAAEVEAYLAGLLVTFLGAKATPAFAMFDAIHQTAQSAGLRAAAKSHLSEEDFDILAALLLLTKSPDKHRNRFAHWLWAYSEEIEDGIILITPPDNFAFAVRNYALLESGIRHSVSRGQPDGPDPKKVLVYSRKDLQDVIDEFGRVQHWFRVFKRHISPHLDDDALQYRLMQSDNHFRLALDRVRSRGGRQP